MPYKLVQSFRMTKFCKPHGFDKTWIVGVISNPVRFSSRYDLYTKWYERMRKLTPNVFTVELQLGDRPWAVTDRDDADSLNLRSFSEIWAKETMQNAALSRLPDDWEYVVFCDCDVYPIDNGKNWIQEIVEHLQRYMFVQPWQHCIDLGPDGETIQAHESFVSVWQKGKYLPNGQYGYPHAHPGFVHAFRREVLEATGGVIDHGICGAGDHHLMTALIGQVQNSYPGTIHSTYKRLCLEWQARAEYHVKRDIGFMPWTILHEWHGKKKTRFYQDRWQVLTKNTYNPDTDLKRDVQGIWQLEVRDARQRQLRDDIRQYHNSRREDSVDAE